MVAGNDGSSQGKDRGCSEGVLEAEKARLSERVSEFSDAVRDTGRRFTGGDDNAISRLTNQAADSIGQARDYLNRAEPRQLVRDATDMARRRPEIFIGGALLAGLLLGRFLRSQPDGSMPAGEGNYDQDNDFGDAGGAPTFGGSLRSTPERPTDDSSFRNDGTGRGSAEDGGSW